MVRNERTVTDQGAVRMVLLTQELRALLQPLPVESECPLAEMQVLCHFFSPDSGFEYFITHGEWKPTAPRMDGTPGDYAFFGWVIDTAWPQGAEWGYFQLSMLEAFRGPLGLPLKRDIWWQSRPANEVIAKMEAEAARDAAARDVAGVKPEDWLPFKPQMFSFALDAEGRMINIEEIQTDESA